MSQWQFTKEDVYPSFADLGRKINGQELSQISPDVRSRVKASETVTGHGTDRRVLQFHLWVVGQVFDRRYFKYEVQHDPVERYTGTSETNWAIQFWLNKIRGVYHERDLVIARVRAEIQDIVLPGFVFEENKQAISLIHRFKATSLKTVQSRARSHLLPLINKVHPLFCAIVDAFGERISNVERRRIIKGTLKPTGLNRISGAYGSAPEYGHQVSKALRQLTLERDDFKCRLCGRRLPATQLHADHVQPFSKEGLTLLENLQTLCATCNLKKGARLPSSLSKHKP
jgi:5-methylcytosine-specific restriction protein A